MAIKYVDAIVDLQYGDTGKGKVAHHLAKSNEYDLVLRYNGGANAGHTIYHEGVKVVTHQIPVGVLFGKKSLIGPGCVVNINKLREEIDYLNKLGFDTNGLILIDKRVNLVTEDHLLEDSQDIKIGTTKQGIGPAYRDKYARKGIRLDKTQKNDAYEIVDIYKLFHQDSHEYCILCEGAQGFYLDIDWGDYPYVTSSHCTIGSVCLNGIPPQKIRRVYGVMKAYETYVGNRTDYTDETNPIFKEIQRIGKEYGSTTGRPRQVNWMNIYNIIKAIQINGVTDLIINKVDVLQKVNQFGINGNDHSADNSQNVFYSYDYFYSFINSILSKYCKNVTWSTSPDKI